MSETFTVSHCIAAMDRAKPVSTQLTLFAEAFPASPTRSPALAEVPPTSATSGRSSPDSFASLNPDGSWRKTSQGYCQVTLDGSLERFSETWPRAGMTRSGTAFRLAPSAPLTDATVSGSWPTPCAEDAKNVPYQKGKDGTTRYPMLLGAVAPERMWPTPTGSDWKGSGPTVIRSDGKIRNDRLDYSTEQFTNPTGGQLNPTWVEWLMGYPLGWTACAPSATASSRKSRSGSSGASPRRR